MGGRTERLRAELSAGMKTQSCGCDDVLVVAEPRTEGVIKRRKPLPTPLGVSTNDCGSEGGFDSLVNIFDSVDSSREGTSSLT